MKYSEGFGYKWCSSIRWEDLMAKKAFTIKCPHADQREAAFRFQGWVQTDANESTARYVPDDIYSTLRMLKESQEISQDQSQASCTDRA